MAGGTAEIARLLWDGSRTPPECARRLGIAKELLDARLLLMERQGYLSSGYPSCSAEGCTCGHRCASCSRKNHAPVPKVLTLTRKGERLLDESAEVRQITS
jgi:hypothetical protein